MKATRLATIMEPYIIAETAYNHEGDIAYLCRMVDEIAELGLDAIKFHLLLNPESYMQREHPLFPKTAQWVFSQGDWDKIIDHSKTKGLDIVALCDDVDSIQYVINDNKAISAVELHATGLNDHFLLEAASGFKGQIILGIGGSTVDEIQYAVDFLRGRGSSNLLLMYGFQAYPTDYVDINLSKALKIRDLFGLPVGYADHTAFDDPHNEIISVMGAAMGISVLEKHYTPDYGQERIDYQAAVGKETMKRIKDLLKLALVVYGSGDIAMSEPERKYGNTGPMKKAIVARRDIRKGEKLALDDLWFKRTARESSLQQSQLWQLIGLAATEDIQKDEIVDFTKVDYEFKAVPQASEDKPL